jgi:O-antigen/teichoic acid export membrane protein
LLSLLFVIALEWHWQGRMLAIGMSSLLCSALALVWMWREGYLVRSVARPLLSKALRFGSGVVPHELGSQAIRLLDRLFLAAMVGLASAGQYAVAAQVASVMLILLSAFNRAWTPYLFAQLERKDKAVDRLVVNKSYLVIACFGMVILGFNLVVPTAYEIFIAPNFHRSMEYVPWLTLGYFFAAVYLTYIDYVFYTRKTHVLAAITMFNLTCNVALNYALISRYGSIGAAYAFAVSMFLVMLVAFVLSNRLHPMPWLHWARRPW